MTALNNRHRRRLAVILVAASAFTFACSSDGTGPLSTVELPAASPGASTPGENAPAETAPAETAPAETAAPAEPAPIETSAPAEQAPPATTPTESGDDSNSTTLWLLVIGGLALVGVLVAVLMRRPRGVPAAASPEQVRLDAILRSGRTMHDSTVLAVLQPHDPVGLQSMWNIAQPQLIDLEAQTSALVPHVADAAALPVLQQLGGAFTGMRQALEANVGVRLAGQGQEQSEVVDASTQTALSRRTQLDAALQQAVYLRL